MAGWHGAKPKEEALHSAVMQRHGITKIISADRHFDDIPGITRFDPANRQGR